MTTARDWFLVIMGREQGPFSTDDMRNLVADGSITPDTLIRRGDQAAAVAAAQIRGLLPTAAVAAPGAAAAAPTPTPAEPARAVPAPKGPRPATAIHVTSAVTAGPAASRRGRTPPRPLAPEPITGGADDEASPDEAQDDLPEESQVPAGRASATQRLRSLAIDFLLIGGLAFGLIFYAWGMADRASGKRVAAIDAVRKSQSEAQVSNRGEPRPPLAEWPTVETDVKTRIAAKRLVVDAANAALPKVPKGATPTHEQALQQAAAVNLANELDFLVKYQEFETNAYAKETAQIAVIREATTRSSQFLIGFGVILLLVIAPICELLTGGTPGKLMIGLRAVGPGRKSIGFVSCLIRHAARFVPGVHAPLFTAGDDLALHDRWSNSEVVIKSAVQRGGRKSVPAARESGKARSSSTRAGSQTGRASRNRH